MKRRAVVVAASLGAAGAVLALPLLGPDRYVLKVLTLVGINALIVLGLALLFGYAGQVSLGHAAFFGIGAYASAYLARTPGLPWPLAVLGAVAAAACVGWAVALPGLRLRGHYLAMATLGFNEIMSVAFVEARRFTGGNDGLGGIPFPSIGPYELKTPAALYLVVWGAVILAFVGAANVVNGRPGRAMRALHGTEPGALACGIDVSRIKVRAFTLSAALAGLAGSLYAHTVGFVSPTTFGLDLSILLVAAVVLGGRESLVGPVVAIAGLTLLQYVGAFVPGLSQQAAETIQSWVPDIVGLTVVAVLVARSLGASARLGARVRAGEGRR